MVCLLEELLSFSQILSILTGPLSHTCSSTKDEGQFQKQSRKQNVKQKRPFRYIVTLRSPSLNKNLFHLHVLSSKKDMSPYTHWCFLFFYRLYKTRDSLLDLFPQKKVTHYRHHISRQLSRHRPRQQTQIIFRFYIMQTSTHFTNKQRQWTGIR